MLGVAIHSWELTTSYSQPEGMYCHGRKWSFHCHVLGLLPVPPSLPGYMPCILSFAKESVSGFFVYTLLDDEGPYLIITGMLYTQGLAIDFSL